MTNWDGLSKLSVENPKALRWYCELIFSIYISLLFAWWEESRPVAWSMKVRYLYHPPVLGLDRIALFHLQLFLVSAVTTFLLVRLMESSAVGRASLLVITGIVAVAGIPIACWNGSNWLTFHYAELAIATVCFTAWVYRKWTLSTGTGLFLLVVHCGFWFVFGPMAHVAAQSRSWWTFWDYASFAFPAIGLCYSVLWGNFFRSPRLHLRP